MAIVPLFVLAMRLTPPIPRRWQEWLAAVAAMLVVSLGAGFLWFVEWLGYGFTDNPAARPPYDSVRRTTNLILEVAAGFDVVVFANTLLRRRFAIRIAFLFLVFAFAVCATSR